MSYPLYCVGLVTAGEILLSRCAVVDHDSNPEAFGAFGTMTRRKDGRVNTALIRTGDKAQADAELETVIRYIAAAGLEFPDGSLLDMAVFRGRRQAKAQTFHLSAEGLKVVLGANLIPDFSIY